MKKSIKVIKTVICLLLAATVLGVSSYAGIEVRKYAVHDMERKNPPVIEPARRFSQPPSDAIILFDGTDLSKWQNSSGDKPGAGWVIENDVLARKPKAGMIWTKERFGNFILDLEFKTEGNSGIFFRTDNPKDCVQTGLEMQIYKRVNKPSRNSCGAIYDALAPSKEMTKDGQWNHVTITAEDNKIRIVLNGEQIIDMDLNRWTEPHRNPDPERSKNKFRTALKDFKREGHIGFQEHGANVWFRKVRIKRL